MGRLVQKLAVLACLFALSGTLTGFASSDAFAAAFPGYDGPKFEQLIDRAIITGSVIEFDQFELRSLSRITPPDLAVPHTAEYFSTIGGYSAEGKYSAYEVGLVSENWAIDAEGNWDIEQRTWRLTTTGELFSISHSRLVETPDGAVLLMENLPCGGTDDPAELELLSKKIAEWL